MLEAPLQADFGFNVINGFGSDQISSTTPVTLFVLPDDGQGGWAISAVSTTEPGTLMLTLTRLGLLGLTLVLRKRKAHDLAQTT